MSVPNLQNASRGTAPAVKSFAAPVYGDRVYRQGPSLRRQQTQLRRTCHEDFLAKVSPGCMRSLQVTPKNFKGPVLWNASSNSSGGAHVVSGSKSISASTAGYYFYFPESRRSRQCHESRGQHGCRGLQKDPYVG